MKKSELRQIINEEIRKVLKETKITLFTNDKTITLDSEKIKMYKKSKSGKYNVDDLVQFKYGGAIINGTISGFFVYNKEEYFYDSTLEDLAISTKHISRKLKK